MIRGHVTGRVWATKRLETVPGGALLEIRLENGSTLVALDVLGCGPDEEVIVTTGSVAAGYFPDVRAPIDALVIGSVDRVEKTGGRSPTRREKPRSGGPGPRAR